MSLARVIVIKGKNAFRPDGDADRQKIAAMLRRGLQHLAGSGDKKDALSRFFSPSDRVGVKINTIGGRKISTRPELALTLTGLLVEGGLKERNVIIWDRTNRELREAGYTTLSVSPGNPQIFATDTAGVGYESELVSHRHIGSLLSTILTRRITASISLAILKDHGLAGITAGMKNYFGAIHNPNKYHDTRCDPFIADLFDVSLIKTRHRLSVIDALLVQYHRGPSFHSQWAEKCGTLIFSQDPVAADFIGWRMIEQLRAGKGLPSLAEEDREPVYLATAEAMGLGRAAAEKIQIIEDEV
jgi:uncharacterized protein (DUF362 family)